MEVLEKVMAIVYSMLMLLNAALLRKMYGTWMFPASLFSLFWFAYTFFPLVFLFEVPVNANSIGFITICILSFTSSCIFFNWKSAFTANLCKPPPQIIFNTFFLRSVMWISISVSILASIMQLLAQGFALRDLVSNPIVVASEFANSRYADSLIYTVFGPISLVFSYISIILGGLIIGSVGMKSNKKILLAFLPSIIVMLTQSAKGLFFLSVFLFLGGMMISKLYANRKSVFSFKTLKNALVIGLVLCVLVALSFLSRGAQDFEDTQNMFTKLRFLFASYIFTHVYGFSDWFSAYCGVDTKMQYDTTNYYMGFYTLTAFFKMFGSEKLTSPGVYDEFFTYKELLESNIYTIFRGLIMDFGLIGSVVFMCLNGFFLHLNYYIFLRQRRPIITGLILIFMLGYFYMSFIISMLTWVIIPFTFIICCLILKFNNHNFVLKKSI